MKRATVNNGNHTVKLTEAFLTEQKYDFKKKVKVYRRKKKSLLSSLVGKNYDI